MKEIIKKRIQEKTEWINRSQDYLDETKNLTKKERNHYLKEMIKQFNLIEELKEVLDIHKIKTLENEK